MKTYMNPKVTVITVVYNGEKYLEEAIQSVINQAYKNIEYIIIDGGSTDGTVDIIKKYEDKIDYWVSEEDNGIYDAMNKGIKLANGDYIAFLNADDWYNNKNVIQNIMKVSKGKYDFLYGDINYVLPDNQLKIWKGNTREDGTRIPHPSCFVKSYLLKDQGFDEKYKIASDYEMTLRLFCKNIKIKYVDCIIVNFRVGGVSSALLRPMYEDFSINRKYFGLLVAIKTMILKIYSRTMTLIKILVGGHT